MQRPISLFGDNEMYMHGKVLMEVLGYGYSKVCLQNIFHLKKQKKSFLIINKLIFLANVSDKNSFRNNPNYSESFRYLCRANANQSETIGKNVVTFAEN